MVRSRWFELTVVQRGRRNDPTSSPALAPRIRPRINETIGHGRRQTIIRISAMKGDTKVIEYLNKALRHELTAVNQYWLH